MECAAIRESTSRNHANGSIPDRLQVGMKLRNTANEAELQRAAEGRVCAVLMDDNSATGISAIGEAVHDALRVLADQLVAAGICVEVAARTE